MNHSSIDNPIFNCRFLGLQHTCIFVALLLALTRTVSVARAADFPTGSYSGTRPNGDQIVIKFEDGGKFFLMDKDGKLMVAGAFKTTKNQIELKDENGPLASKDAKPGTYKWKLESDKLTFTKIEDESEGRQNGLTRPTWTRQK